MVTTAERLQELAEDRPNLNQSDAAKLVGVTRERVRQLVTKHGLVFHRGPHIKERALSRCVVCGLFLPHPSKSDRPKHHACFLPRLRCAICGDYLHIRQRAVGRQREMVVKHRQCLMSPVSTPCRRCGQSMQLDARQRWAFRKGVQKTATCFACRDGKGA